MTHHSISLSWKKEGEKAEISTIWIASTTDLAPFHVLEKKREGRDETPGPSAQICHLEGVTSPRLIIDAIEDLKVKQTFHPWLWVELNDTSKLAMSLVVAPAMAQFGCSPSKWQSSCLSMPLWMKSINVSYHGLHTCKILLKFMAWDLLVLSIASLFSSIFGWEMIPSLFVAAKSFNCAAVCKVLSEKSKKVEGGFFFCSFCPCRFLPF